ncbi:hypothetical protein NQ314_001277 [Rhamnusium bicolor]|uniref:Diphthine--ammonia ligase n=1 Tax=Rhamnusium bicolor TaxID=1586634 RepID=A0AAV8ZSZ3_9CUCU|nr:hypothetical protein NQ314_001277 [Rhamnusium bicolor]
MKVVALISGGKDSTFNMMQCIAAGHEIVALANLVPHSKTEIDSYMYQSVGHEAIDLISDAIDLPLYKRETLGISNERGKTYQPSENDEVEDLYLLLQQVKDEIEVEAVSVGAILSDYQRVRVENVEDSDVILHSNDPIAPVGYLKFKKLALEVKLPTLDLYSRLEGLPLKDSDGYVTDHGEEAFDLTESAILSANKHSVEDVCSVCMFIGDMSQYAELNKLYINTFNHVNPPSRACVQVPFDQKCPVRIEALSWKQPSKNSGDSLIKRKTMHVQSRSHWAPANIGPYSQSVRIENFIHLAGQIGLVPGSMEMVNGGIKSQCQLALRHLKRLLKAVDTNFNLRNVVQGICYVTDISYVEPSRKMWEERTNNAIVDYVVVTGLPRDALVEWHVWAHKHNNQFEYEERGKCIDNYSISIYRRWNYENNIVAILCRVDHPESDIGFNNKIFREAMDYTLQKLKQGQEDDTSIFSIKIFYSVTKNLQSAFFIDYFEEFTKDIFLSYTFVPVISLKNRQTFLSICGIRIQ